MTETSNSLPEWALQLLRSYAQGDRCVCDLAINTLNQLERALESEGVQFDTPGFNPGVLTRQYSRDSVLHFPDTNVRYSSRPALFRTEIMQSVWSRPIEPELRQRYVEYIRGLSGHDNLSQAPDVAIRRAHVATLRLLLQDSTDRVQVGAVKRLLDRPAINQHLIDHQLNCLI